MKKRTLGNSGIEVSALGYGCVGARRPRLLAQKPWIVPIPGTRKVERLKENIGSDAVHLTDADLSEIEDAASKITVHGARLPAQVLNLTNG